MALALLMKKMIRFIARIPLIPIVLGLDIIYALILSFSWLLDIRYPGPEDPAAAVDGGVVQSGDAGSAAIRDGSGR